MRVVTRFVLRHRLLVAAMWVLLAVAGALTAGLTTSRLTNSFAMPGAAYRTDARIAALYGTGAQDPLVPVITVPATETIHSAESVAALGRAFAAAADAVAGSRVADYPTTGDPLFLSSDGRSAFALVFPPPGNPVGGDAGAAAVQRAVLAAAPPSWHVRVTGIQALANTVPAHKGSGVLAETLLGALGALLVLAFVFGSFLAVVPLLTAAISILTTFLAVLALTEVTAISQIIEFLIALIGLGVSIDYSLLVVTRWREERAAGKDNIEAVEAAMSSAGRAVVLSGISVGIGLLALLALPVPFLRSLGIGGVLLPLISVAVAVTLLPVILGSVGPRLDYPRRRGAQLGSRPWTAWARLTVRHRGVVVAVGALALGLLVTPAFSLRIGEPRTAALAQTGQAHEALLVLEARGIGVGTLTPIDVLTTSAQAVPVARQLTALPGVQTAFASPAPSFSGHGTRLVTVIPLAETNISSGQATVRAVRRAVAGEPGVLGVDGSGATTLDFDHDVYGNFPLVLAMIAVATFLLLARAFRSLLLALKAVLLNLLSLAAAYGVMVMVWQEGHGAGALWGVPATGAITMWVPIMVFAFLFGLSMDYEVFILARMREAYDRTGSTSGAVVEGIGHTGRLVSSAALILLLAFLSMSTAPQTDIKILATGLGAGILVDATLIRCLLLPALVSCFGRYNWWLPTWAATLLRVAPDPLVQLKPEAQQKKQYSVV